MKTISLFLLALISSITIHCQNLVPYPQPGLIQGEVSHGNLYAPGITNTSFYYSGDTIISNNTYSHFQPTNNSLNQEYYTTYDSGKVTFHHTNWDGTINGNQTLLYDFSLQLNDTFPSIHLHNPIVDSVSTITLLNGEVRKYMELTNTVNGGTVRWVDGIGDIEHGFQYRWDFEGGHDEFSCHRDSSGLVYTTTPSNFDCDSLTQLSLLSGLKTTETSKILIYPNPTKGIINVRTQNQIEIEVFNLEGDFIFSSYVTTLDLTCLSSGIYIVKITSNDSVTISKIYKE